MNKMDKLVNLGHDSPRHQILNLMLEGIRCETLDKKSL